MTAPIDKQITGIILSGGLSRRMGGGDKGLIELAGTSMVARVAARIRPQVDRIVLNANGPADRFAHLGLPVVADTVSGFVGPLAGVLAGMRWSMEHAPAAKRILTVSADAPFVPLDLATRLADGLLRDQGACIALASSGGRIHPVIGLWPVSLAGALETALMDGERRVGVWAEAQGRVAVEFLSVDVDGESIDPFYNANTPEELDEARRIAGVMERRHTRS